MLFSGTIPAACVFLRYLMAIVLLRSCARSVAINILYLELTPMDELGSSGSYGGATLANTSGLSRL